MKILNYEGQLFCKGELQRAVVLKGHGFSRADFHAQSEPALAAERLSVLVKGKIEPRPAFLSFSGMGDLSSGEDISAGDETIPCFTPGLSPFG